MSDDHVLAGLFRRRTEVNALIDDRSADPHARLSAEDEQADLVGLIVAAMATTIEGMRIKAKVVVKMLGEDADEDPAIDLIRSLIADLRRGEESA